MGVILVVGSSGQLGSVLVEALQNRYGSEKIIATDIRPNPRYDGKFISADATKLDELIEIVEKNDVDQIYHLAAVLSATGEKYPLRTWDINMQSFFNVLEVSVKCKVSQVFFPSSIAVFGSEARTETTFQLAPMLPATVYGISKVAGENWAMYYHKRYGLDIRSIRYPGIIGYQSAPGGGTTDYAVDIFHHAIQGDKFTCFLDKDTRLPMMYMDDAIRATIELMEAPAENISVRTGYNICGVSFTPEELVDEIRKYYPEFEVVYRPDFRQDIADTWPESIEDSVAHRDWSWKAAYGLEEIAETMIKNLQKTKQQMLEN